MRSSFLLAVAAIALMAAACGELGGGTGQISQKIGAITKDPNATEVDLPKLTSFGWDRFHFFKAGTTREDVCKFIGADQNSCGRIVRYPTVPPGSMALLFSLNGRLTHIELHALENGQFDLSPGDEGHLRSASVFKIRRSPSSTGQDTIRLVPL